jgi:DNA polymerase-3 subunit beta
MQATLGRTELVQTLKAVQAYLKAKRIRNTAEVYTRTSTNSAHFTVQIDEVERLEVSLPASETKPGEVQVDIHKLLRFVRSLPDELIEIDCHCPPKLTIQTDTGRFTMACREAERRPTGDKNSGEIVAELSKSELGSTLKKLVPSMSTDFVRMGLCVLHIATHDGKLLFCTTDGHRLAMVTFPRPEPPASPVNIQSDNITALKAAVRLHDQWSILSGEGHVEIKSHRYRMVCREYEHPFPDFKHVVPTDDQISATATVNIPELKGALHRCALLRDAVMAARLDFSDHSMVISARCNGSEYREVVKDARCTNSAVIGLNPRYLLDVLRHVNPREPLRIQVTGPLSPIRIPSGDDTYILMPMRIDDF